MALAATAMLDDETLIGVARYVLDKNNEAAEFAIVVADAWQGRGIGSRLLGKLIDVARSRGLKRLYGEILATNRPMLELVRKLHFKLERHEDATLTRASLVLGRHVARLIVLDARQSILLVRYLDGRPGRPVHYWATPGGALEPGESHLNAARRELLEETGLMAPVGRELWQCSYRLDLPGGTVDQHERYFLVQVSEVAPAARNRSSEDIAELRWWPVAALRETAETVFPEGLVASLAEAGLLGR